MWVRSPPSTPWRVNMNEQLYQDWIDALESDEYLPNTHSLKSKDVSNKFCCLGLICNIYDPIYWTRVIEHGYYDEYEYLGFSYGLPDLLVEELNFETELGIFNVSDLSENLRDFIKIHELEFSDNQSSLAYINDHIPNPFPFIAKILRERPPSLFANEQETV